MKDPTGELSRLLDHIKKKIRVVYIKLRLNNKI